jgi:hypothetical protein
VSTERSVASWKRIISSRISFLASLPAPIVLQIGQIGAVYLVSSIQGTPAAQEGSPAAILQRKRAGMAFGDLPAEHQSDARASRFGGEERDEQVGRSGKAWAIVGHPDFDHRADRRAGIVPKAHDA